MVNEIPCRYKRKEKLLLFEIYVSRSLQFEIVVFFSGRLLTNVIMSLGH